jgi:hypothetical protein
MRFDERIFFYYAPDDASGGGSDNDESNEEGTDENTEKGEKESATKVRTLDDIIKESAEEVEGKKSFKGTEDEKEEKEKEEEEDKEDKDEDKEEEEEDEEELSAEQLKHAKNIFKLLSNKSTAKDTLLLLAKNAGLNLDEGTTKKEEDKLKKTIKDIIVDKLGDKYKFMSEALGEALELAMKDAIESRVKQVEDRQAARDQQQLIKDIETAQQKVLSQYSISKPKTLMAEIVRIQEEGEYRPKAGTSHEAYFKACMMIAAENLDIKMVKKGTSSTTTNKDNKADNKSPLRRIAGASKTSGKEEGKSVTKVKNFSQAVDLAVEQVGAKLKA